MDEQHELSETSGNARPGDDPWLAFSYLVAGVGVYGFIGWALGRWLHADYLTPIGIVAGAVFGLYLVVARFVRQPQQPLQSRTDQYRTDQSSFAAQHKLTSHTRPDTSDESASFDLPDNDDRGDTA